MKSHIWWHFRKYKKGGRPHVIIDEDSDGINGNYTSYQITSHDHSGNSSNIELEGLKEDGSKQFLQRKRYFKPKRLYGKEIHINFSENDYDVVSNLDEKKSH